jgi:hypothetical protein
VSSNPVKRIKNHVHEAKTETNKSYNLYKSRWLRSVDFIFRSRIIFSGTEDECYQKEVELISLARKKNRAIVNTSSGGDKPPRISELSNFDEIKKKIGNKARGRVVSDETRNRMSIAHKNKKNKTLKALSGYENPRARPVAQIDDSGRVVFIWACATEAVSALGLSRTSVTSVCAGYQKTAGGYRFTYF